MESTLTMAMDLGDSIPDFITEYGERFAWQLTAAQYWIHVVSFVIAIALCFWGFKLFKVLSAIECLGVGALIGLVAAVFFNLTWPLVVIVPAIVGLIFATLGIIFSRFGIFFICLLAGFNVVALTIGLGTPIGWIIAAAFALLAAILGAIFKGPIAIIMTALQGGILAGFSLLKLFNLNHAWIGLGVGVVLVLLGMITQFMMKSREIGRELTTQANDIKEEESIETEVESLRSILEDSDDDDDDE